MSPFLEWVSGRTRSSHPPDDLSPPRWTPAIEPSYENGRYSDATLEDCEAAKRFCDHNPVDSPKLLSSHTVERISEEGCKPWEMKEPDTNLLGQFKGIKVEPQNEDLAGVTKVVSTKVLCEDTCIFSNLPIMAGLYDTGKQTGVYYEVVIEKMGGIIAIGISSSTNPPRGLITHAVDDRFCVSSVPLLEVSRMESSQRRVPP